MIPITSISTVPEDMDEIDRRYPIEVVEDHKPWTLTCNSHVFFELPENLIDKYLPQLIHSLQDYFECESRLQKHGYRAITLGMENERFFVMFNDNVLDFLKMHNVDFIERIVKIGIMVAGKRNCNTVQMRDIQPYLAVAYRVYINDAAGLRYFLFNKKPAINERRVRPYRWIRSNMRI